MQLSYGCLSCSTASRNDGCDGNSVTLTVYPSDRYVRQRSSSRREYDAAAKSCSAHQECTEPTDTSVSNGDSTTRTAYSADTSEPSSESCVSTGARSHGMGGRCCASYEPEHFHIPERGHGIPRKALRSEANSSSLLELLLGITLSYIRCTSLFFLTIWFNVAQDVYIEKPWCRISVVVGSLRLSLRSSLIRRSVLSVRFQCSTETLPCSRHFRERQLHP